jgi:hypothetical protein
MAQNFQDYHHTPTTQFLKANAAAVLQRQQCKFKQGSRAFMEFIREL